MSDFIKPKKLTFEQEMGVSSYSPQNASVAPVQPIKTDNQNAQTVKTDLVIDEEVAAELGRDYKPPCSQLTHEKYIRNAKERILERRKKVTIQGRIKYISNSMD